MDDLKPSPEAKLLPSSKESVKSEEAEVLDKTIVQVYKLHLMTDRSQSSCECDKWQVNPSDKKHIGRHQCAACGGCILCDFCVNEPRHEAIIIIGQSASCADHEQFLKAFETA